MHEIQTIVIDDPGRLSVMWFHCAITAKRIEVPFVTETLTCVPIFPSDSMQPSANYFGYSLPLLHVGRQRFHCQCLAVWAVTLECILSEGNHWHVRSTLFLQLSFLTVIFFSNIQTLLFVTNIQLTLTSKP